jgi:hypothetical protein
MSDVLVAPPLDIDVVRFSGFSNPVLHRVLHHLCFSLSEVTPRPTTPAARALIRRQLRRAARAAPPANTSRTPATPTASAALAASIRTWLLRRVARGVPG